MGVQLPDISLLTNLLSGLVGSVMGAFIGAKATLKATQISLNGLYRQEKERREYELKQQNLSVVYALLKEVEENLAISEGWANKTNTVLMSREAWDSYKGHVSFLPEKLQRNLPHTYYLISEYNSLVEYDRYKLTHGAGYVDDKMRAAAEKFKENVGDVIDQLKNILKKELGAKD